MVGMTPNQALQFLQGTTPKRVSAVRRRPFQEESRDPSAEEFERQYHPEPPVYQPISRRIQRDVHLTIRTDRSPPRLREPLTPAQAIAYLSPQQSSNKSTPLSSPSTAFRRVRVPDLQSTPPRPTNFVPVELPSLHEPPPVPVVHVPQSPRRTMVTEDSSYPSLPKLSSNSVKQPTLSAPSTHRTPRAGHSNQRSDREPRISRSRLSSECHDMAFLVQGGEPPVTSVLTTPRQAPQTMTHNMAVSEGGEAPSTLPTSTASREAPQTTAPKSSPLSSKRIATPPRRQRPSGQSPKNLSCLHVSEIQAAVSKQHQPSPVTTTAPSTPSDCEEGRIPSMSVLHVSEVDAAVSAKTCQASPSRVVESPLLPERTFAVVASAPKPAETLAAAAIEPVVVQTSKKPIVPQKGLTSDPSRRIKDALAMAASLRSKLSSLQTKHAASEAELKTKLRERLEAISSERKEEVKRRQRQAQQRRKVMPSKDGGLFEMAGDFLLATKRSFEDFVDRASEALISGSQLDGFVRMTQKSVHEAGESIGEIASTLSADFFTSKSSGEDADHESFRMVASAEARLELREPESALASSSDDAFSMSDESSSECITTDEGSTTSASLSSMASFRAYQKRRRNHLSKFQQIFSRTERNFRGSQTQKDRHVDSSRVYSFSTNRRSPSVTRPRADVALSTNKAELSTDAEISSLTAMLCDPTSGILGRRQDVGGALSKIQRIARSRCCLSRDVSATKSIQRHWRSYMKRRDDHMAVGTIQRVWRERQKRKRHADWTRFMDSLLRTALDAKSPRKPALKSPTIASWTAAGRLIGNESLLKASFTKKYVHSGRSQTSVTTWLLRCARAAISIQRMARGYLVRHCRFSQEYQQLRFFMDHWSHSVRYGAAVAIQAAWRGFSVRQPFALVGEEIFESIYRSGDRIEVSLDFENASSIRRYMFLVEASLARVDAASTIQMTWRAFVCRTNYAYLRDATLLAQRVYRGHRDRRRLDAGVAIQSAVRMLRVRWRYQQQRKATVIVQKYLRRRLAISRVSMLRLRKRALAAYFGNDKLGKLRCKNRAAAMTTKRNQYGRRVYEVGLPRNQAQPSIVKEEDSLVQSSGRFPVSLLSDLSEESSQSLDTQEEVKVPVIEATQGGASSQMPSTIEHSSKALAYFRKRSTDKEPEQEHDKTSRTARILSDLDGESSTALGHSPMICSGPFEASQTARACGAHLLLDTDDVEPLIAKHALARAAAAMNPSRPGSAHGAAKRHHPSLVNRVYGFQTGETL